MCSYAVVLDRVSGELRLLSKTLPWFQKLYTRWPRTVDRGARQGGKMRIIIIGAALSALLSGPAFAANLLQNGSFESGPPDNAQHWTNVVPGSPIIPSWSVVPPGSIDYCKDPLW